MYFQEAEHITLMRESIRRFLDEEVPLKKMSEWDEMDEIPYSFVEKLGEMGLGGLTVSESYGGAGSDYYGTIVAIEELARRSTAIASLYIMNACYGGMNISACGSEEQKKKLLPQLAEGKILFSYGLSEPDVGSDLASVRTKAERRGDHIVVNGIKRWCTGANVSDYIYCLARTGDADARYNNLSFLLIPTDSKGVSMTHSPTLGLRGLATNDVVFDNVEIGEDSIVGGVEYWNHGWGQLMGSALEVEKIEVAAMALGVATQAVEDAWSYAEQRTQFGKKIGAIQSVRHQLAEVKTKLLATRLMVYHGAHLAQSEHQIAAETSMVKNFACETCVEIVLSCQKVMGAYGYSKEFPMERYVRDILVMPIFGGSTAIHNNNIAKRLFLAEK